MVKILYIFLKQKEKRWNLRDLSSVGDDVPRYRFLGVEWVVLRICKKISVEGFRFECLWSLPQNQNTENVQCAINRLSQFTQIGWLEKLREGSPTVAHANAMPSPINQNPPPY